VTVTPAEVGGSRAGWKPDTRAAMGARFCGRSGFPAAAQGGEEAPPLASESRSIPPSALPSLAIAGTPSAPLVLAVFWPEPPLETAQVHRSPSLLGFSHFTSAQPLPGLCGLEMSEVPVFAAFCAPVHFESPSGGK